jgi:hypothetical protein
MKGYLPDRIAADGGRQSRQRSVGQEDIYQAPSAPVRGGPERELVVCLRTGKAHEAPSGPPDNDLERIST